jgi:hypothetical protein
MRTADDFARVLTAMVLYREATRGLLEAHARNPELLSPSDRVLLNVRLGAAQQLDAAYEKYLGPNPSPDVLKVQTMAADLFAPYEAPDLAGMGPRGSR